MQLIMLSTKYLLKQCHHSWQNEQIRQSCWKAVQLALPAQLLTHFISIHYGGFLTKLPKDLLRFHSKLHRFCRIEKRSQKSWPTSPKTARSQNQTISSEVFLKTGPQRSFPSSWMLLEVSSSCRSSTPSSGSSNLDPTRREPWATSWCLLSVGLASNGSSPSR